MCQKMGFSKELVKIHIKENLKNLPNAWKGGALYREKVWDNLPWKRVGTLKHSFLLDEIIRNRKWLQKKCFPLLINSYFLIHFIQPKITTFIE